MYINNILSLSKEGPNTCKKIVYSAFYIYSCEKPIFSMTSSKHENIFLRIYKEMNHTCKMDYLPRPENNILSLYKEMNVSSKMQYSSNTVKELRLLLDSEVSLVILDCEKRS